MVSKVIRRVFTYLGALFLMSYIICNNVSAFDMILDYDNYDSVQAVPRVNVDCNLNGTLYSNQSFCSDSAFSNTTINVRTVQSSVYVPVKAGDIVAFDVLVIGPTNFTFNYGFNFVNAQMPNARVIGYQQTIDDDLYNSYYLDVINGNINSGNYISRVYTFYGRVNNDYDQYYPGLVSTSANYPSFSYYKGGAIGLNFKIININVFRKKSENETNKEQEEKTQEAADASADAGDSSSSDAEQGTASLISAIGSAVSVISSASPTNCKINGNMGNLDVGQIDLCANPVPTFIQVIGSLILILITVPLCITLFNRFIALFRSFQG